jgi:outer membrane immunogenic protein
MKLAHSLLAGAALAVTMASSASAADLLQPADPIYSSPLFNFEGLYAGVDGGGSFTGGGAFGNIGVVVGANFAVTDGILAGIEFQGDTYWNGAGYQGYDALGLGRIGGFVSDNTMLYGDLGAGVLNGAAAYAFGGGVEFGITSQVSVRGDLQGIGAFGAAPTVGKATVGLLFHMQ